jgi:hypothetical protein
MASIRHMIFHLEQGALPSIAAESNTHDLEAFSGPKIQANRSNSSLSRLSMLLCADLHIVVFLQKGAYMLRKRPEEILSLGIRKYGIHRGDAKPRKNARHMAESSAAEKKGPVSNSIATMTCEA